MQESLIAGDTLNYRVSSPDYSPADGWVLRLRLLPRSSSAAPADITATAESASWLVQVGSGVTAAWTPGSYSWAAWVERGSETYTIETGQISVLPDPRQAAAGTDTRSLAEKGLEAVQALLLGKATSGHASYQINGRQLTSYSLNELFKLESKFKTEVDQERVAAGLPPIYNIGRIRRILTRIG